jgi:hypothetical protein
MTSDEPFTETCHATVPWRKVEPILIQRSRRGSFFLEVGSLFLSIVGPRILESGESKIQQRLEERGEEIGSDLRELAPFINHADFFVGARHDWEEHGIGFGDEKIIRHMVDAFYQMNVQLAGEGPKSVDKTSTVVDFSRHLVSVGGPIPNWYFRNLMYGNEVDLPYKFHLNPEPERVDLSDKTPKELRRLGRKDTSVFQAEPNWFIADSTGAPADVFKDNAIPEYGDVGDWITDYFMILKAPNIHPACDHNRRILSVAGCHWLGGMGAIDSLTDSTVLSRIKEEVGDGDFQALGRVVDADVDEEDRRVEIDQVKQI